MISRGAGRCGFTVAEAEKERNGKIMSLSGRELICCLESIVGCQRGEEVNL